MQDLGLKILNLHVNDGPGETHAAVGAGTSSTTPIAQETGYEPPYPPTTDPVLQQTYRNDALSRFQQAQALDETIARMEAEHEAFHEAIEQGIRHSAEAKANAKAKQRLAIFLKLKGTVPEVNLLARVPMDDVDNARPNAQ
eukprot:3771923-Amphidinium_carterae.1